MAWSFLQSKSATTAGATTLPVTFTTANLSFGSKLIAYVALGATTATTVTSVKDGAGNTMTALATASGTVGGNFTLAALYAMDTPPGDVGTKPTITVTISASTSMSVLVQEISGLLAGNTSAMLDGTPSTVQGSSNPAVAGAYSSTAANEFLAAFYGDQGDGATFTIPATYTADPNNINASFDADIGVGYKNSASGAETASFTLNNTPGWGVILAAFKLAGPPTAVLPLGTPTLASAAFSTTTQTVTATWGAGQNRTAGNLLLGVVTVYGTTSASLGGSPSGWTLVNTVIGSSRAITAYYTKTAAGSDAAPVFSGGESGTAADATIACVMYELQDPASGATPFVYADGTATGTSGTITPATGLNVPSAGCAGISAAVAAQGTTAATTTWTTPSGWALGATQTASARSQMASYQITPGAGSALSCLFTHSRTSTFQSALVIIVAPSATAALPLPGATMTVQALRRSALW